ncbi:MAG TPA: hypothetical protein EYH22_02895 [Candidatus Nanopusillus sp.]|nr:hypothetical protein [Candidatus Nanopusillus sp.]
MEKRLNKGKDIISLMMKGKTLKAIGTLAVLGVAAGLVAAQTPKTLDAVKKDIVSNPSMWKIVVGADAKASDVIGAVEIATALQYYSKAEEDQEINLNDIKIVLEKETTKISGEVPLYKGTDKILLGEGLTGGGVAVISENLVFGSKTFEDSKGNKYDYILKLYPNNGTVIKYKDKPDTDADDPVVMLDAGNNHVYRLVVSFTKPLSGTNVANNVKAQEIELFGKKYYIDTITNNKWILREAAKVATLKPGETTDFEGKIIKLIDVVEESTGGGKVYAAVVDVDGERKKITESLSEKVGGVDIFIKDAYVSTTQEGVAYAELVIGGRKIELVQNSNAKVEDKELDNVYVTQANLNGLELQVKFASDSNKNYLEAGKEFVDPLFGTFKLVFAPVDLKAGKSEVKLEPDSSTVWKLTVTDFRGYTKTISVLEAKDQNNDGQFNATDFVGLYSKIKGTIYKDSGDGTNGPTLTSGEYVAIVDNQTKEYYLLRLESIQTDKVVFKDVFADKSIEVPLSITTGTLDIGAKTYTFTANKTAGTITFNLGNNTDFSTTQVEFFTKDAQRIVVQAGQAIDTNNDTVVDSEQSARVVIFENDDNTDTNADITLQFVVDENDKRVKLNTTNPVTIGDAEGTLGTTAFQEKVGDYDYKVLGQYGAYIEYNTKDQGYVKIYLPKEQVWYDIKLAPTEAEVIKETKEVSLGDEVEGWKVADIIGLPEPVSKVILHPLIGIAILDDEVQIGDRYLIAVGGPAVNRITAEFLGLDYPTSGERLKELGILEENKAIIRVAEKGGKVAVLVFGWEARDTRRATREFAQYLLYDKDAEAFEGATVVEIVGNMEKPSAQKVQ